MKGMGGKKMAQLIKALAVQPDDLGTIPNCSMKSENSDKKRKPNVETYILSIRFTIKL